MASEGFPLAAMGKLFKQSQEYRVSCGAKKALHDTLVNTTREITLLAGQFAEHAQRHTILRQDVDLAISQWEKQIFAKRNE